VRGDKIPTFPSSLCVGVSEMIRYFKVAIQNHAAQSIARSWGKIKQDFGLENITAFGQKGHRAAFVRRIDAVARCGIHFVSKYSQRWLNIVDRTKSEIL
jgi:predicted DNA-binding WGR domain protein